MEIKITQKDVKDFGYSMTGRVIDELAYCANKWTEEDLIENNWEYEPLEPYNFNYEADLLSNTKTLKDFYSLQVNLGITPFVKLNKAFLNSKLQAGAFMALNYPDKWEELLNAYKENLKENRTESISESFNKELQKEIDEYYDNLTNEWLYGDYRDYEGVVIGISNCFTESRDNGIYITKDDIYILYLDKNFIEEAKEAGYSKREVKKYFLQIAKNKGFARKQEEDLKRQKRQEERKRLAEYKEKQKQEEKAEREAKLKTYTL